MHLSVMIVKNIQGGDFYAYFTLAGVVGCVLNEKYICNYVSKKR